ncbi:hypothetical protein QE152_g22857 [Popillia japonica]|uniref:CCHC-type domain-containing protein n=1 Tax=Popillia japonica TaxID=7064 RepID=A0AAW1KKH1_POPJA
MQVEELQTEAVHGVRKYRNKNIKSEKYRQEEGKVPGKFEKRQSNVEKKFNCYRCKTGTKKKEKFLGNLKNVKVMWKRNLIVTDVKLEHGLRECPAYGKKCTKCGTLNHFARACRIKNVKEVQEDNTDTDNESENDERTTLIQITNQKMMK